MDVSFRRLDGMRFKVALPVPFADAVLSFDWMVTITPTLRAHAHRQKYR
jgi:hypothetical protein